MLRPSRPLLASLFAACLLAVPALACAQNGGYDPARVQSISDPRFQNQIMQSSQAVAEALVGRRANATDQEILRKFAGQQSSFLRTLENAARAMPQNGNGYDNRYDSGNGYDGRGMSSADLQAIAELSRTPEGRRVLEQLTNQRYNNANSGYDSGYNGYQQGGYPQNNQQKPAQVLRDALLQDLTNAATNAAYGQPVYRGNGVHP